MQNKDCRNTVDITLKCMFTVMKYENDVKNEIFLYQKR